MPCSKMSALLRTNHILLPLADPIGQRSRRPTYHQRGRCCPASAILSQCKAMNQCCTARQAETIARTSITALVDITGVAAEQRLEP